MLWIALELADLQRVAVDVGEQPAGRFAVEAGRGHEHEPPLDLVWPGFRVELNPVVPALPGRESREMHPARARIEGLPPRLGFSACRRYPLVQPGQSLVGAHASGTAWPACTYTCSWRKSPASAATAATGPRIGASMAIATRAIPAQNGR